MLKRYWVLSGTNLVLIAAGPLGDCVVLSLWFLCDITISATACQIRNPGYVDPLFNYQHSLSWILLQVPAEPSPPHSSLCTEASTGQTVELDKGLLIGGS